MVGQGKLNGQVEPDKALEEEPGGGVPDERVLLRPDGGVSEGVLEEGRHHLQVSQGASLVTDSSLDIVGELAGTLGLAGEVAAVIQVLKEVGDGVSAALAGCHHGVRLQQRGLADLSSDGEELE